jgi:hypothetical protein
MDTADNIDELQANSSEATGSNEFTTNAANGDRLQANSNEAAGPNRSTTNAANSDGLQANNNEVTELNNAVDSTDGVHLFGRQTSGGLGDHKELWYE